MAWRARTHGRALVCVAVVASSTGCDLVLGGEDFVVIPGVGVGGSGGGGGSGSGGGHLIWARSFGAPSMVQAAGVAVDDWDDVVIAGHFDGAVDFGDGELASTGGFDLFVVKIDDVGDTVWSVRFGDGSDQLATAVAVDPARNVIVAGVYLGTLDFGPPEPLVNPYTSSWESLGDGFVVKLDPDGNPIWSKNLYGEGAQIASALAITPAGWVCVAGSYQQWTDLDCGDLPTPPDSASNAFVVCYDETGDCQWQYGYGGPDEQRATGLAAIPQGDLILTGAFRGDMDLGGEPLANDDALDGFVARIGQGDGTYVFGRGFDGAGDQELVSASVEATGPVLTTGRYAQTGSLDGEATFESAGGLDAVIVAWERDGEFAWAKSVGAEGDDVALDAAFDSVDRVVVTGSFTQAVDFGDGPLYGLGSTDVFVASLDLNGYHVWSRRFGDAQAQRAAGLAIDGNQAVYVLGSYSGTMDLGGAALESRGAEDVFLLKLAP